MSNLEKQLLGWRLTTAEIYYFLPDHPSIMQRFTWQEYDKSPDFPQLYRFLEFWQASLDGKLHSVEIMSADLLHRGDIELSRDLAWLH